FNVLLQVLDDGRLTDNKGHVVNFKNTLIIMTSNLGSDIIRERMQNRTAENRRSQTARTADEVMQLLKHTIRPEFLNRIDETIVFTPLTEKEIYEIVRLQLDGIVRQLADNDVVLHYTEAVVTFAAREGYDPQFGARPVKRVLQRFVLNELSKALLADTVDST
ncbi:AAA family ATPase, partial [Enterococcus faecalis]|nr:AAA family ATPase [Enterococcus faecalis]